VSDEDNVTCDGCASFKWFLPSDFDCGHACIIRIRSCCDLAWSSRHTSSHDCHLVRVCTIANRIASTDFEIILKTCDDSNLSSVLLNSDPSCKLLPSALTLLLVLDGVASNGTASVELAYIPL